MQELIAEGVKVDAVVTDPPYGINANKMTLGSGKKNFDRGGDLGYGTPRLVNGF
jgi:tRNA G10  N-methylase Trm11